MISLKIILIAIIISLVLLHWLVYKLVAWRKGKKQAREKLISLLILSFTFIICIAIAEVGTRVMLDEITTTAYGNTYFSERWRERENIKFNSLGYREQEIDFEEKVNISRIVVIGDSFTFGQGIPESHRFSNLIERKLSSNTRSVEVLNFGISGAGTRDHINTLNKYVIPLNPDIIILQWFINDVDNLKPIDGKVEHTPPLTISQKFSRRLLKRSALYFLINNFFHNFMSTIGSTDRNYEKYLIDNFYDNESKGAKLSNEAIYKFIEICKQESIPLGIVLFPQPSESLADNYPLAFLSDRVLSQCEQQQIPCLDLRETYSKVEPVSLLWVNKFDQHPSSLANKLAAEKIISYFGKEWLLSKKAYK